MVLIVVPDGDSAPAGEPVVDGPVLAGVVVAGAGVVVVVPVVVVGVPVLVVGGGVVVVGPGVVVAGVAAVPELTAAGLSVANTRCVGSVGCGTEIRKAAPAGTDCKGVSWLRGTGVAAKVCIPQKQENCSIHTITGAMFQLPYA